MTRRCWLGTSGMVAGASRSRAVWSIRNTYVRHNQRVQHLLDRLKEPHVLLRPPAVSQPLLVLDSQADAPEFEADFRDRAAAATVIDDDELQSRLAHETE